MILLFGNCITILLRVSGQAITTPCNKTDKNKFTGIGIRNIQSRVDYLKGTVEWEATPGRGTLVAIHIPSPTAGAIQA